MNKKVGLISLGCQKNLVDSEVMLGILVDNGFIVTDTFDEADLVVINTCSFIGDAREETEYTINEYIQWKRKDPSRKLIVTGCHVQREKESVFSRWPDIDGIVGVRDIPYLPKVLSGIYKRNKKHISFIDQCATFAEPKSPRIITANSASSFIKIADGCNNHCSYCIIPQLRGSYQSRVVSALVQEARELAEVGIRELNLVAQDVGAYGCDTGKHDLVHLIRRLCKLDGIDWVRLLYLYPDRVTRELLELIKQEPKVCKYVDIPMQHVSDRVLSAMNRRSTKQQLKDLIAWFRDVMPEVVIRSTFIVGFPGEEDEDFQELVSFIQEMKLEKVGFFKYSPEQGTKAATMAAQISEDIKEQRYQLAVSEQSKIMDQKNEKMVGRVESVLMDTPVQGRYYGQAPEIDGYVLVDAPQEVGSFRRVRIVGHEGMILKGECLA